MLLPEFLVSASFCTKYYMPILVQDQTAAAYLMGNISDLNDATPSSTALSCNYSFCCVEKSLKG